MWYVEVLIKTYNEGDRTFYDAIILIVMRKTVKGIYPSTVFMDYLFLELSSGKSQ